jgi:hypothetical protein
LVTAAVGVPVIAPVAALNESPAGKVPLVSDHVYGAVPPVAPKVAEYALPTCPFAKEVVVIERSLGAAAVIVSARLTLLVGAGLLASVTLNVSGMLLTATVGVPLIAPVAAFSDKPAGNAPAVGDQE